VPFRVIEEFGFLLYYTISALGFFVVVDDDDAVVLLFFL
jgi:hypothetical protein